jgi:hypothetical protein
LFQDTRRAAQQDRLLQCEKGSQPKRTPLHLPELEEASEAQLRHMQGGKDAKAAGQQKAKIRSQQR